MTYEFYKVMHIIGLMFLFSGIAVIATLTLTGQLKKGGAKALGFALHGLGLILVLVAGFGMLARLNLMSALPSWVHAKIGLWVLLALAVSLLKRKQSLVYPILILCLAIGGAAGWIAIFKPF